MHSVNGDVVHDCELNAGDEGYLFLTHSEKEELAEIKNSFVFSIRPEEIIPWKLSLDLPRISTIR